MKIEIKKNEVKVEFQLIGRLDTITAPDFDKAISEHVVSNIKEVEIDCCNLSYISSAGLRCILKLQKTVSHNGGKALMLNGVNESIREILDMTGFSSFLVII